MAVLNKELNYIIGYFYLEWDLIASFASSHSSGATPTIVKQKVRT